MQGKQDCAVVFDFDGTLVNFNTHNTAAKAMKENPGMSHEQAANLVIPHMKDRINNSAEIMKQFSDILGNGIPTAIVSRNEFPNVIQAFLNVVAERTGNPAARNIPIIYGGVYDEPEKLSNMPKNWHRVSISEAGLPSGLDSEGKNTHIERFKQVAGLQSMQNGNIMLVDDSAENCRKANESGYAVSFVPEKCNGNTKYLEEVSKFKEQKQRGRMAEQRQPVPAQAMSAAEKHSKMGQGEKIADICYDFFNNNANLNTLKDSVSKLPQNDPNRRKVEMFTDNVKFVREMAGDNSSRLISINENYNSVFEIAIREARKSSDPEQLGNLQSAKRNVDAVLRGEAIQAAAKQTPPNPARGKIDAVGKGAEVANKKPEIRKQVQAMSPEKPYIKEQHGVSTVFNENKEIAFKFDNPDDLDRAKKFLADAKIETKGGIGSLVIPKSILPNKEPGIAFNSPEQAQEFMKLMGMSEDTKHKNGAWNNEKKTNQPTNAVHFSGKLDRLDTYVASEKEMKQGKVSVSVVNERISLKFTSEESKERVSALLKESGITPWQGKEGSIEIPLSAGQGTCGTYTTGKGQPAIAFKDKESKDEFMDLLKLRDKKGVSDEVNMKKHPDHKNNAIFFDKDLYKGGKIMSDIAPEKEAEKNKENKHQQNLAKNNGRGGRD